MQLSRKQMPWVYSGMGALTMAGLMATAFALRQIWMRRSASRSAPDDLGEGASEGASLVEELVSHNTKGF